MPSPFPGMDPYLENPIRWSGFHHTFLTGIQERLAPILRPKYFVRVEERVWVALEEDPAHRIVFPDVRVVEAEPHMRKGIAAATTAVVATPVQVIDPFDREIHEYRLEVRDLENRSLVDCIELLSPSNKIVGSISREGLLKKRREVYASDAHWIEIDLLRAGARTANLDEVGDAEYQVFLSRAGAPRRGWVWPITLRQRLPVIAIPLLPGDPDAPVDLQQEFDHAYEINGYEMDINYDRDPVPPLASDAADWARELIKQHELGLDASGNGH
jgi:hypothetical protein